MSTGVARHDMELPSPIMGNGYIPDGMEQVSWLLTSLPAVFHDDDSAFLTRYLHIFETILDQHERRLDALPSYFTAYTAPDAFLPWLASWVGLILEPGWPVERQRAILARAMELHRRRGTVLGIVEHVFLYTGVLPTILERGSGLVLGKQSQLGYQTMLGRGDNPYAFTVVLRVPDPQRIDRAGLRTILEAQRPAHTSFAIFVLPVANGSESAAAARAGALRSDP